MRLERHLANLETNLSKKDEGHNVFRLKSGEKKAVSRQVSDLVERNGDTEDKLNFAAINSGYAGLRPGIYDKKRRKAAMNRDQNVDVYHQI